MAVQLTGRIIVRERLVAETNTMVKFYSIGTTKGWYQAKIDKLVDMKKIEVPGLVKATVTSAKSKTVTTEDGKTYVNKSVYITELSNVDEKDPVIQEYLEHEQRRLEEKLAE